MLLNSSGAPRGAGVAGAPRRRDPRPRAPAPPVAGAGPDAGRGTIAVERAPRQTTPAPSEWGPRPKLRFSGVDRLTGRRSHLSQNDTAPDDSPHPSRDAAGGAHDPPRRPGLRRIARLATRLRCELGRLLRRPSASRRRVPGQGGARLPEPRGTSTLSRRCRALRQHHCCVDRRSLDDPRGGVGVGARGHRGDHAGGISSRYSSPRRSRCRRFRSRLSSRSEPTTSPRSW